MKSVSPPPGVSAVQQRADRDRFRVEPGRIENYTIGKGSLAQQESYKVRSGLPVLLSSQARLRGGGYLSLFMGGHF